ncbi:MAG: histidine phosphatase family protein [Candidatus Riflebacteria bacterium]|nr:histidine phosphatase family protein [Candidatus Riflebacteria bacterium]
MITTLYLLRHCQSQPSSLVPESRWPLSPRGYAQAQGLVDVLSVLDIDIIYSSPYRRCIESLEPTAGRLGLPIRPDPELRERLISPAWVEDFREIWRRSWEDLSFALDGGESSHHCQDRATRAMDRIVAENRGRTVGIGSHGNALALFLAGFTPGYGIEEASSLRTPELLRVTHGPDGYRWDRDFERPGQFDQLATDYRETPGIIAG